MLEDHSSRWSAAASPGGLIGLVLVILSGVVVVVSTLGITDRIDLGLDDTVLYVALGVSILAMLLFLYLLLACLTIRYRTDANDLVIAWGLRSIRLPFAEIAAVAPATEVLGENVGGLQLYWPGYYVGKRKSDLGPIRVVSTLPPKRQVLIARTDGEIFAVSPEYPQLFMEELTRGYTAAASPTPENIVDTSVDPGSAAVAAHTEVTDEPSESEPAPVATNGSVPADHPPIQSPGSVPSQPPTPAPAFGHTPAQGSHQAVAVEERPKRRSIHGQEPEIPELQDIDTARYRLPDHPEEPGLVFGVSPDQAAAPVEEQTDGAATVTDSEPVESSPPPVDVASSQAVESEAPIAAQESVDSSDISEEPQLEVVAHSAESVAEVTAPALQEAVQAGQPVKEPLTRDHHEASAATSPALQPSLVRDPVAITFSAVGLLATSTMAIVILVQYQEIADPLILNWDVDGLPARVGSPQEIWLLPIMAGLVLIANIGIAWSISKFDQFAARMMLGSTLIAHLVIWVALVMMFR